jgi:tetratricopeptide (TPR) repeat protein
MKLFVILFTLFLGAAPLRADAPLPRPVDEAYQLWRTGHSAAAVAQLEPFLHGNATPPNDRTTGVAWGILGSSYLDVERFAEARRAYERALAILKPLTEARNEYAAVLDSLGILEQSLGHAQNARPLCRKAQNIYVETGNHTGIVITATNLAVIAYVDKDYKASRRSIAQAIEEMPQANGLRNDDMAALDAIESAMSLHDGKKEEAMTQVQHAINLWERTYGPDFFMLPNGYLLRAQVSASVGDRVNAMSDANRGLARAQALWGKDSVGYLSAEGAYARVLQICGDKQQARRLTSDSRQALADLEQRQCSGCTVNANSFY